MWDDVIIGKGNKLNSAVRVFSIEGEHGISHNNVSYWISDLVLGLSITIFKYTEIGERLTKMIRDKKSTEEIIHWLNKVALSRMDPDKIIARIEQEKKKSFRAGQVSRSREFQKLLEDY